MTAEAPTPAVRFARAELGNSSWLLGNRHSNLAESPHTGKAFAFMDTTYYRGCEPPPHLHTREDELFCVLEGRVRFMAGTIPAECGPGAVAYLPAGLAHAFQSLAPEVRLLIGVFPGGIENYFQAIGEPAAHMDRPPAPVVDVPRLISLGADYGLEFLAPGMAVADHPSSTVPGLTPLIRLPEEGTCLNVLGVKTFVKVAAAESSGAVSVFVTEDPKLAGPPLHLHRNEDEAFFVLEGEYRFQTGDTYLDAGPGNFAFIPRGVAHTYARTGDRPGRLLIFTTPGGFETFFSDIDTLCRQGPPEIPALAAIGAKHGVEFVGPPIGV